MDQNSPNPPKKFWKLPLYLGRTSFFFALVPMAMLLLCIVTKNSVYSLIDLYYCFITPMQICKWSVILSLILSFVTSISAGLIYNVDGKFCLDEYRAATSLTARATLLIIFEMAVYFLSV
ncbi:MAG: hypothetical protein IKX40_09805 [Thermoguttaceae bacterium]|nr:hypothetical protein [Thermoguttaceae bacterium]